MDDPLVDFYLSSEKFHVLIPFADLGGYSQNFLRQILKIVVTLGLNILRFYRPNVFFKANISKV